MFKKSKILKTIFAECDGAFDYIFTGFFWFLLLLGLAVMGVACVKVLAQLLA